ncbi:unnamed protein product [Brachionus calyciflorus]|uniref:Uncharacterized protein n=1 Tax=Brachionus calyciflorus TaxID=104777 RepID=A0A813M3N7_9BILA|nr:unnamed protein product [Brachionus calyciflorus]
MFKKGIVLPIVWLFVFFGAHGFIIDQQKRHNDLPTLLLVSFDGFRWDYIDMYNLTNFNYLKNLGSHADYIRNSFSTVTFPNHWTIVTGLYEESHGILQNNMYDPLMNKTFNYKSPESQTIEWYGQNKQVEPIWVTNQKAGDGRRSAAEWIGANVVFQEQNIINIQYNKSKTYKQLIDEFINLFKMEKEPINFGAIYFDEPDHVGHYYGPYSIEMKTKLEELDEELGYMIEQLRKHDLFDNLNLIITSDHGMDTISNKTAIFLDNYIDTSLFKAYGSRACYNIFLNQQTDLDYVYKTLKTIPNIDIYLKADIPERFNYKKNSRIGDILLVTKIGHAVYVNKEPVNWTINNGDHGYDNNESSMHPLFIAHGPAFKKSFKTKVFNNVDIYPLMCSVLGIEPALNNGSIANVEKMLVANQQKLMLFFIIIFSTPIFTASATGILLCISGKSRKFIYKNSITIYKDPLLAVESKIGHFLNNTKQEKKQHYFNHSDWKRRSV